MTFITGEAMSVPPKSASNYSIYKIVCSIVASVYGILSSYILSKALPKLTILNLECSGSDFKKRIKAFLACSIL